MRTALLIAALSLSLSAVAQPTKDANPRTEQNTQGAQSEGSALDPASKARVRAEGAADRESGTALATPRGSFSQKPQEELPMRKVFPVVISGLMAVSFSQFAAAQSAGVQGPAGTGANVDLNRGGSTASPDVQNNQQLGSGNQANQQQGSDNQAQNTQQRGAQNQNSQQYGSSTGSQEQSSSAGASSGASDDKNPNSPGKGWAKGHERGKGNPHGSASGGSSYDRDSDRRDRDRHSTEQSSSPSSTQEQNKKD